MELWEGGGIAPPDFSGQLTLFQPGMPGHIMPITLTLVSGFSDLPTALNKNKVPFKYSLSKTIDLKSSRLNGQSTI